MSVMPRNIAIYLGFSSQIPEDRSASPTVSEDSYGGDRPQTTPGAAVRRPHHQPGAGPALQPLAGGLFRAGQTPARAGPDHRLQSRAGPPEARPVAADLRGGAPGPHHRGDLRTLRR